MPYAEVTEKVKEITLEATIENIKTATDFIDKELEALACPLKAQMQIDVAIDELFGNIVHYAYSPGTGYVTLRFDYEAENEIATVTFEDNGIPYNPLEKNDPDVSLTAEDRGVGGLGIFLVKKTMDFMDYQYKDNKNILCIGKRINR